MDGRADDIVNAIESSGAEPVQLRIGVEDHQTVTLVNDPLTTTIDKLYWTRVGR